MAFKPVSNRLEVWHYPQVPCQPFRVPVKDEVEAYKITKVLAEQHLWLYDNNIIPDYSNAIVVVMWDENSDGEGNAEWVDYYNEEEGMDWDDLVGNYF